MSNKSHIYTRDKSFYFNIGNNSVTVTRLEYASVKIHDAFDGYKILHISDLHNNLFGSDQSKIIAVIKHEHPDIIVVTGDLIDRRHTDIETAMAFILNAVSIAPVYFVSGNHETLSKEHDNLFDLLKSAGVMILDNSYVDIKKDTGKLRIAGLPDPSLYGCDSNETDKNTRDRLKQMLNNLINAAPKGFNILLSHRPDLIDMYSECKADLVFSGHAHGGQVRLPFIGGLYSPGQGIFPRLTAGIHIYGNTSLVLSRGLGNSLFPLRVFNPPEIIVVKLVKLIHKSSVPS